MRRVLLPLLGLTAALAPFALAEEAAGPPKVLLIAREEIKPGKMSPHEKVAASFVALGAKAKTTNYRIGLTPVTGDDNVVLYLEAYPSFAALEESQKKFEETVATNAAYRAELDQIEKQGDMHASQKTALYRLREDLSYRPRGPQGLAQSRYLGINTVHVKYGRGPDYVDYVKTLNAAREKANVDIHTTVYQVSSGAPYGTFLILSAVKGLSEWDQDFAKAEERQKAVDAALGGPEVAKQRRMLISEIVASNTNHLYALDPSISRPPETFVAHDPGFWAPKPATTAGKALAVKKEAKKP